MPPVGYSVCILSHVRLFATPWIAALQVPLSTGSSGKNTGVGCHALLQGLFPAQGLNLHFLHLLHCRGILYHWATGEALETVRRFLFLGLQTQTTKRVFCFSFGFAGSSVWCAGFSSCGEKADLVASKHVGLLVPCTGMEPVSCIGRWILYLWTTRESPQRRG